MSKKIILPILILAALIGFVVTYFVINPINPRSDDTEVDSPAVSKDSETTDDNSKIISTSTAGVYTTYTKSKFESSTGTRLLFFHAPWCPQCRALDADIKSADLPQGITVLKVDYDSNQDLRSKYGVTIQTTVVKVDEKGKLVKKFVAYEDPSFSSIEDNLLK